jgi:hypothetical protein
MNKEICNCGRVATWDYMPGYVNGGNSYHCDDCVPRGCECQHRNVDVHTYHPPLDHPDIPDGEEGVDWKWVEVDKVWCHIDEKGREFPCVEYSYSLEGYDIENEE